jgi:hypothetical protein
MKTDLDKLKEARQAMREERVNRDGNFRSKVIEPKKTVRQDRHATRSSLNKIRSINDLDDYEE